MLSEKSKFNLPSDCKIHICSFLSLSECIFSYGLVCKETLFDVIPALVQRRVQFEEDCKSGTSDPKRNTVFLSIPKNRISCLFFSLPREHPSRDTVHKLYSDLNDSNGFKKMEIRNKSKLDLQTTLNLISKALNSHKLHCLLLTNIVAKGILRQKKNSIMSACMDMAASLDTYVGDVMIAAMLIPNLENVEGGIICDDESFHRIKTETDWIRYILQCIKMHPMSAQNWYLAWVLIHSSIIRMLPTTPSQRQNLGMKFNSYPNSSLTNIVKENMKDPCTFSALTYQSPRVRSELLRIMKLLRDIHGSCSPCFNIRDFGPLGPSFRGRDRLRFIHVHVGVACTVLINLIYYFNDLCRDHNEQNHSISSDYQMRLHMDLEWLYDVHKQTFQSRPMNVSASTVRFETTI